MSFIQQHDGLDTLVSFPLLACAPLAWSVLHLCGADAFLTRTPSTYQRRGIIFTDTIKHRQTSGSTLMVDYPAPPDCGFARYLLPVVAGCWQRTYLHHQDLLNHWECLTPCHVTRLCW